MELKRIIVENFKSLKRMSMSLDEDIMILVGHNNSGKGNVLEGISYLRDFIRSGVWKFSDSDYGNIVFGKDRSLEISFELFFSLTEEERINFVSGLPLTDVKKNELKRAVSEDIGYRVSLDMEGIVRESLKIHLKDREVEYAMGSSEEGIYTFRILVADSLVPKFPNKPNFRMKTVGGGFPATSIIHKAVNHPRHPGELFPMYLIYEFFEGVRHIPAMRHFPDSLPVMGVHDICKNGANFPQVLNSLAASDRKLLDEITEKARKIFPEIEDICTPITEGGSDTCVAVSESPFREIIHPWKDLSSGMREIIFQLAFLCFHKDTELMMLDRPEVRLHGETLKRYLDVIKEMFSGRNKKLIIATHSPVIIDSFDIKSIFHVVKGKKETVVFSSRRNSTMEEMMEEAGFSKGSIFGQNSPRCLLVFERRGDGKIFRRFMLKRGRDPVRQRIGIIIPTRKKFTDMGMGMGAALSENMGMEQAIKFVRLMKRTEPGIPVKMILGSDTIGEIKQKRMEEEGFTPDDYVYIGKRVMEDYLLDGSALAKIAGKDRFAMEEIIARKGRSSQEKLENIIGDPFIEVREEIIDLIIGYMSKIPEDISDIIESLCI